MGYLRLCHRRTNCVVVARQDRARDGTVPDTDSYAMLAGFNDSLVESDAGYIAHIDDQQLSFTSSGLLTRVESPRQPALTIERGPDGLAQSVEADGRAVFEFTYTSLPVIGPRLTSVREAWSIAQAPRSVGFEYDGFGRLIRATDRAGQLRRRRSTDGHSRTVWFRSHGNV